MKYFLFPPAECSPAYFWYLNEPISPKKLRSQLREMAARGVKSVCPHPWPSEFRPVTMPSNMKPEYLSEDYFKIYGVILDECKKLGMNCWLYDEGGWPSGGAGGRVRACHPVEWAPQFFTKDGIETEPYTPETAAPLPNTLIRESTDKFLELTHARYYRHFTKYFGSTFRFVFMDEPRMPTTWPGKRLTWCPDLPEEFKKRKSYDLTPWLPQVLNDTAPAEVKIDFHDVTSQLFVERFLLPIRKWCRAHEVLSGGHFGGENEPEKAMMHGHGQILRSLRALDLPGVDAIWRQVFPGGGTHVFPKFASSVAHQAGHRFVLSELFAVYGNGVTPEQRQYLTDYMFVRGITAIVFSKLALTMEKHFMSGCRPHFGPVDPLWKYSREFHEYITRVSYMLTRGEPVVPTAVYFDARSFWAGGDVGKRAVELQRKIAKKLLSEQCDFDFVDDDVLASAKNADGKLEVGKMLYSALIVPDSPFLPPETSALVKAFCSGKPEPLLKALPKSSALRVCKRQWGKRAIYFCVNESASPLNVTLEMSESPAAFWNPADGADYRIDGNPFQWYFEPFGSALFVTGKEGRNPLPHYEWERPFSGRWTLKPLKRHMVGKTDFEIRECHEKAVPAELGEWKKYLGDNFSGDAVYACEFTTARMSLCLNLWKVAYSASVKINGKEVGRRFRGPFVFDLSSALTPGRNRLEVTVSNTLANALAAPEIEERLKNDFPPCSPYEERQRKFESDSLTGGLFGPVRFGIKEGNDSQK